MALAEALFSQYEVIWNNRCALHSGKSPPVTVGFEQEFFVYNQGAEPQLASLEDTQRLFHATAQGRHWKVQSTAPNNTDLLTRVSFERTPGRYSALKYEYPPYLLEVAFTWYDNLTDLNQEFESVWGELESAAKRCELQIVLKPFIEQPVLTSSILRDQQFIHPKYLQLSQSRRDFYLRRGEPVNEHFVNFPGFMAASQTQIGGLVWWRDSRLMHQLYAQEIEMEPSVSQALGLSSVDGKALQLKRHTCYQEVFKELRLLGVPNLPAWTLEHWADALCESPLMGPIENGHSVILDGMSLKEYASTNKVSNPENLISLARDLQIIRPRSYGAIEFRG